jgi:tRNA A-37 threonylcarbamoyl transferase component Bud32
MHDDANSTAKWLSSLSEGGVGFRVWDSTIDLEFDRDYPVLTGNLDTELVITTLPEERRRKPFDEAALMAELMGSATVQEPNAAPSFRTNDGSAEGTERSFNTENQSTQANFAPSLAPPPAAPNVVPQSTYTWQSSRQPPPSIDDVETEKAKPAKKAKPVIIIADHYQVVSGLGKGVMCTVYKVKDLKTGKLMVLKLLPKDSWSDARCLERLQREASAIEAINHANLIAFHTHGFTADSHPFLVMDYLNGITLSRAIAASDGLPLPRVVQVLDQLCRGLAAAHENGIPHRDIRPENIMFLAKSNDYNLKLVDFGIAKIISEGLEPMKQLALTGEIFGNPPFMSPEECRGEKLDARSDIYSLGCVLYNAITGKPPFSGNSSPEILKKQQHETLPQPSKVKPSVCSASQAGWVTVSDLDYIVMRCLEKNREDRYQSVQEILQDLVKLRQLIPLQEIQPKAVKGLRTTDVDSLKRGQKLTVERKTSSVRIAILVVAILATALATYTFLIPKSVANKTPAPDTVLEKPVAEN